MNIFLNFSDENDFFVYWKNFHIRSLEVIFPLYLKHPEQKWIIKDVSYYNIENSQQIVPTNANLT